MWNRAELKERGKAAFKINYWKTVLIAFILALTSGGFGGFSSGFNSSDKNTEQITQSLANTSSEEKVAIAAAVLAVAGILFIVFIVLLLLQIFLFNPIQVGCYGFLQKNVEQNGQFDDLNILKDGFANYSHTLVTMLLKDIFLTLWFCLFIIPGFVKSYSYRMVPFIVREHPELSPTEVITKSREMMDGQKWNTFVLDLSFIGWILLSIITCGIVAIFWTNPYMKSTNAALYLKLKELQTEMPSRMIEAL